MGRGRREWEEKRVRGGGSGFSGSRPSSYHLQQTIEGRRVRARQYCIPQALAKLYIIAND